MPSLLWQNAYSSCAQGKLMAVRIEDVASLAGVSMKTVSRVLNNEPNVRAQTREKVQAAVAELNYKPHPSARSLAGHRSYLIALLYDNPSPSYLMEIQSGVLDACETHHYGMMLRPLNYSPASDAEFIHTVESLVVHGRPDGLILTPPITDHPTLGKRLAELNVPYACISPRDWSGCIGANLDEVHAASEMTAHLIALGHRRIAHITGHPDHGASGWRLQGYRDALQRAGLRFDPNLVVAGEFSFDSGISAARRLLDLKQPPTAIFSANDDMAAGVINAACERGMVVPRDLSVCGFDDTPMSHQIFPALTTVRQPAREMGCIAATQLLRALRNPESCEMVHVPYTLQLRKSTGPVPNHQKTP